MIDCEDLGPEEFEPEPEEVRLVSALLDGLNSGMIESSAKQLRSMAKLGGFALLTELLTPYFSGPRIEKPEESRLFPNRLILVKASKGRPKKSPDISTVQSLGLEEATAFFEAAAVGDIEVATKELSKLVSLKGQQLEFLALLFDGAPPQPFGWTFKLRARRLGKPRSLLTWSAKDLALARHLREAVKQFPNAGEKEAAIQHVSSATGLRRSAVASAMERLGIRSSNWKIKT